jgi:hypothetical protein
MINAYALLINNCIYYGRSGRFDRLTAEWLYEKVKNRCEARVVPLPLVVFY